MIYPKSNENDAKLMLKIIMKNPKSEKYRDKDAELEEIKEIFMAFDEDGTGELEEEEFVEAIQAAGILVSCSTFSMFFC